MDNVFSHNSGAWARGFVFAQESLLFFLLSVIADTYTLLVRYSLLRLSA